MRVGTAAALWILLLTASCSRNEPGEAGSEAPVQTAPAERAPMRRIIEAQGILHAIDQATIVPKISAPVQAFYVNRGSHVRKGQLLAVLENRDLTAAAIEAKGVVDQAEAGLHSTIARLLPEETAKAKADVASTREALDAAQKIYDSRKELLQQGALARRQVDEANVALVQARSQYEIAVNHLDALEKVGRDADTRQAQAQLEAARGRYQATQAQLEYSRIYSPIDGVISERPLYAGETAGPGVPLLTVMDVSRVTARVNVPAEQLSFLKTGNPASIFSSDGSASLDGKVTVVSPSLDPNSTTAEIWIEAANRGDHLKPGTSVRVSIVAETVPDALVIPKAAILPSEEGVVVMVAGPDMRAHERRIETGIREGDRIQVVKGLEAGEQVIIVGGLGLEDDAKVRIEKVESKADEAAGRKGGEKSQEKSDEKTGKHD